MLHRYGDGPQQVCELFVPEGDGPHAVVVVVHGGYWRARYDRSLMTSLCEDLALRGLAAWNIEYRRIGNGGGWPHTLADVASAVDALADVDGRLDLTRIGAVGHSAGGQLALWAAARGQIRAVVSQAGLGDLVLAAVTPPSDEPTRAFLGGDPEEVPERYAAASPAAQAPLGIPQLVLHGADDDVVSPRISEAYSEAAGAECELRVLAGTGHYEHIDPGSHTWRAAREWLEAVL